MNKPLAAVIDDELITRKTRYQMILADHFDVLFIENETDVIQLKKNKKLRLLIIDNVLSNWPTVNSFEKLMSNWPEYNSLSIPIVAVSGWWTDNNGRFLQEFFRLSSKYPIIDVITWTDISALQNNEANMRQWAKKVGNDIYIHYLMHIDQSGDINPDESINILQLSDMQFGSNIVPKAYLDYALIAENLRNSGITPHIVAVCGDIAQSGKAKEYEKADEWFSKFSEQFDNKIECKRFIFTVGNHDCNYNAFAQFGYNYDFNSNKFEKIKVNTWRLEDNKYLTTENVIFQNYRLFEQSYSSNCASIWRTEKLNVVNDSFINWGIRIICLNTLTEISPTADANEGIDEGEITKIFDRCSYNRDGKNLYTILIAHNTPSELGYHRAEAKLQDIWARLSVFLKNVQVNLWLCGHQHQYFTEEVTLVGGYRFEAIASGSLRLSADQRPADAETGYNLIELKRRNGAVVEMNVRNSSISI